MKDYEKKEKEREGKGASGVSVQYSGIHRSLEDIKGRIAELNEVQQVESQRKKKRHRPKKCERRQWRNTVPQKSSMVKNLMTMWRSLLGL